MLAKSEFKGFDFDFDIPCIVENKAELENRKSCIFDPFEWLSKQMQTNLLLTAIMVQLRKVEIAMKINQEENIFGMKIDLANNLKI